MPWFLTMNNTGQRNETEQSSAPAAATLPSVSTRFTSLTEFLLMATSFVLIIADPSALESFLVTTLRLHLH